MPAARPTRPGHVHALFLAALATAVGIVLVGALPAAAHDQLIETTPETGSVVATSPETLVLRFRDDVLDLSSQVIVRNPVGDVVVDVGGVVDATTLSAPLPPDLADGTYRVVWRVVSGDGHPLQGAFEFSVGAASSPLPSPTVTAAASTSSQSATTTSEPASDGRGSSVGALAVAIGGGMAVVLAGGVVLARRRRRSV
ncbi:MAG: copper resistance CopC family protein [Cellulomonas sp.]